MKALHSVALVCLTAILVSGCDTTRSVVSEVATSAFQDRSAEDQVTDTKIKAALLERLYDLDKMLILDISSDVWEKDLMLSGTVTSAATRSKVIQLARADKRIKALHNHISVVTKAQQETRIKSAGNSLSDSWIETKIKGALLSTSGVRSINLRWRSVLGTVSILGEAGSIRERDTILREIRALDGVHHINNHIVIRKR